MGEPAKPFWIEEEETATQTQVDFEDITTLCTGECDEDWKLGSD